MQLINLSDLPRAENAAELFAQQQIKLLAEGLDVKQLVKISRAHLVGAYWSGYSQLDLLQQLNDMGAKVRVPTTSSASSACMHISGVSSSADQEQALSVAQQLELMGVEATYTCAPYHQIDLLPGECVAWAESNAVVFANSVLAARTQKTPQYIDLMAALCGYVPYVGLYRDEGRLPSLTILVEESLLQSDVDYQLFGLWVGEQAREHVVYIDSNAKPTSDQLRGFGANTSTSGNVPMFHWRNVTPEAQSIDVPNEHVSYSLADHNLMRSRFAQARQGMPSAICIGAPHASFEELGRFVDLFVAQQADAVCSVYLSTSRAVLQQLDSDQVSKASSLGITFVVDTCTYYPSAVDTHLSGWVATNSGKWAYYGRSGWRVETCLMDIEMMAKLAVRRELINAD